MTKDANRAGGTFPLTATTYDTVTLPPEAVRYNASHMAELLVETHDPTNRITGRRYTSKKFFSLWMSGEFPGSPLQSALLGNNARSICLGIEEPDVACTMLKALRGFSLPLKLQIREIDLSQRSVLEDICLEAAKASAAKDKSKGDKLPTKTNIVWDVKGECSCLFVLLNFCGGVFAW